MSEVAVLEKNRSSPTAGLTLAERESIDLSLNLASAIGLPRSVAEIYGILFISPEPLSLEDFCDRLGISRGSASQGLRLLRNLGAIIPVVTPGDRRTFYRAETRIKALLSGFIKEQVLPRLEGWPERIAHMEAAAAEAPEKQKAIIQERVQQLRNWGKKSKQALPVLMKLLNA